MTPRRLALAVAMLLAACGSDGDDDAPPSCTGPGIVGRIRDDGGAPLAAARVTAEVPGGAHVAARTDAEGWYVLDGLTEGAAYTVGASLRDRAYVTRMVTAAASCTTADLALGPEVELGRWENLGDPGTPFGGTNSGVLLPDDA